MVHDPEYSFMMWRLLKSIEWEHLPEQGGLSDQPAWLMEDIYTIQWMYQVVKAQYEANVEGG